MRTFSALGTAILLAAATVACGGGEEPGQQEGRTPGQTQQRPAPGQQQMGQPPAPAPDTEVSEEEMRAFTEAQMALEEVRREYGPQLQSAQDSAEADQIRQEASQLMIEAVREAGLDEQRYTEIARAIQATPELQDRFLEMRRQLTEEPQR